MPSVFALNIYRIDNDRSGYRGPTGPASRRDAVSYPVSYIKNEIPQISLGFSLKMKVNSISQYILNIKALINPFGNKNIFCFLNLLKSFLIKFALKKRKKFKHWFPLMDWISSCRRTNRKMTHF